MSELRYPNESKEYRAARDALQKEEEELVAKVKALAAKRRQLPPGGELKEDYSFQWANEGKVGQRVKFSELFGNKPTRVDYGCIPSAVFSHPPIAGVGMTEGEARNKLGSVKVYQSDFRPMKNVLAGRNERALYKMICDPNTDRVVGLHMIGPDAPEILQAAAVAVKAGLTKADFDQTVALHPTMAEELVLMK